MPIDVNELKDAVKKAVVEKATEFLHRDKPAPAVIGEAVYKSPLPFDPEIKPQCLVIMCGDSRYRSHTERFLDEGLGLKSCQVLAVPGGVQWLALPDILPKHNKVLRWAVGFLLETRDLKRIVCIAHQDCLAYHDDSTLSSLAHLATGKTIVEHQLDQLRSVGRGLAEEYKAVVECYMACAEDNSVVFHKVELQEPQKKT